MTERVLGRGGLGGAAQSVEEEQLVARIYGRMDRLARHSGATGEAGCREFCHGDSRVSGECRVDDYFRGMSGHVAILTLIVSLGGDSPAAAIVGLFFILG
jgi:hypothetical protein